MSKSTVSQVVEENLKAIPDLMAARLGNLLADTLLGKNASVERKLTLAVGVSALSGECENTSRKRMFGIFGRGLFMNAGDELMKAVRSNPEIDIADFADIANVETNVNSIADAGLRFSAQKATATVVPAAENLPAKVVSANAVRKSEQTATATTAKVVEPTTAVHEKPTEAPTTVAVSPNDCSVCGKKNLQKKQKKVVTSAMMTGIENPELLEAIGTTMCSTCFDVLTRKINAEKKIGQTMEDITKIEAEIQTLGSENDADEMKLTEFTKNLEAAKKSNSTAMVDLLDTEIQGIRASMQKRTSTIANKNSVLTAKNTTLEKLYENLDK